MWRNGSTPGLVVGMAAWLLACSGRAAPVPPQLVGAWNTGSTSTVDFVDRNTGAHAAPSGTQHEFRVYSDGTYVDEEMQQVSTYGCTTGYFGYVEGVIVVTGSKFTLNAKKGSLRQWSCSSDYTKPIDPRKHTGEFAWQIIPDPANAGSRLLVLSVNGNVTRRLRYAGPPPAGKR